jgi:transposase
MLNDAIGFDKIFIACGYTDLRFSIEGLAAIISKTYNLDPFERNVLFLFCGRRTDRIKGLLWEGDGFLLLYKRLENGKFQWPRTEQEVRMMSQQQFRWLMEGLSVEPKKAVRNAYPKRAV